MMEKYVKCMAIVLVCLMMLSACATNNMETNDLSGGENLEANGSPNQSIDLGGMMNKEPQNGALAMYDKGYDTIEELMGEAAMVVKATPVSKEVDSFVGVCWILEVAESSLDQVTTVRLRQVKDEYLLEMGKEVVLVLAPEGDAGYYHIPGGGDGLFRVSAETGKMEGKLLGDLAPNRDSLTLDEVYTLLLKRI